MFGGLFGYPKALYYTVSSEGRQEWRRFSGFESVNSSYTIVLADQIRYRDNKNRVEFLKEGVVQLAIHHSKARVIRQSTQEEIDHYQELMTKGSTKSS